MTIFILWLNIFVILTPTFFAFFVIKLIKVKKIEQYHNIMILVYFSLIVISVATFLIAGIDWKSFLSYFEWKQIYLPLLAITLIPSLISGSEFWTIFNKKSKQKEKVIFLHLNKITIFQTLVIGSLEELLYRFLFLIVLFNLNLEQVWISFIFIAIGSVAFSFNHTLMTHNFWCLLYKAILSIFLSVLVLYTKNIIWGILGHLFYNMAFIYNSYLLEGEQKNDKLL